MLNNVDFIEGKDLRGALYVNRFINTDIFVRPPVFPCPFPDLTKHPFMELADKSLVKHININFRRSALFI